MAPLVENCPDCPYRAVGPAVASEGDALSAVVVVGEAPGHRETEEGRPFVGRAGQLLRAALADAGFDVGGVLIVNSVACRPEPVKPRIGALRACSARFADELGAAPRRAIIAVGGTPVRAITGKPVRILSVRGSIIATEWGPMVATIHPARVLRRPAEHELLLADLRLAHRLAAGPEEPIRG
jgi:DNA polymerase